MRRVWVVVFRRGCSLTGNTSWTYPTTATARGRELSRGGGRRNDRIDAAAAAWVAALPGDARPLQQDGALRCFRVLDERQMNLMQSRVIAVKPLYTILQELLAGGTPTGLTATAAVPRRSVRPAGLLR